MASYLDTTKHLITHIRNIAEIISGRDRGPLFKHVFDFVFGILKSSSIVLSDIAHALNEGGNLKAVNNRLYKSLMTPTPSNAQHNYLNYCMELMGDNVMFAVDDSDIQKPYGKAFESMGIVRDGSAINKKTHGQGYMVCSIVGMSKNSKHPIPLYTHIHSSTEKDYLSNNNITNIGIRLVAEHTIGKEVTFVFDRGYDDSKLMKLMTSLGLHYVIRMSNNRWFYYKNKKVKSFELAEKRKGKILIPMVWKGKQVMCKASHVVGRIPGQKGSQSLIFTYLDGITKPIVLMTDKKVASKEDLIAIVLFYHSRWKIEESFRFKKEQLGFENYRVKSLISMNHLSFLLDVALTLMVRIIEREKTNSLLSEILARAKIIREKVYLQFYRFESGAISLLMANKNGVKNYQRIREQKDPQMSLFNIKDINLMH